MIGLKILLTGLVVFLLMAITRGSIKPDVYHPVYEIAGLVGFCAVIAMFSGIIMAIWSL